MDDKRTAAQRIADGIAREHGTTAPGRCRDCGEWHIGEDGKAANCGKTCTGHRYPVNPDAPEEGTDIHHAGPCPAHPLAGIATPARFVYVVDDEPHIGDIRSYASAIENATYSGLDVDRTVWTFRAGQPVPIVPTVTSTGYDEDEYATLTVSIELDGTTETASVRLDGRA